MVLFLHYQYPNPNLHPHTITYMEIYVSMPEQLVSRNIHNSRVVSSCRKLSTSKNNPLTFPFSKISNLPLHRDGQSVTLVMSRSAVRLCFQAYINFLHFLVTITIPEEREGALQKAAHFFFVLDATTDSNNNKQLISGIYFLVRKKIIPTGIGIDFASEMQYF